MAETDFLQPHQIKWANRAKKILYSNFFYIDTTKPGGGKTYVALWIAKKLNLPIMVICPATLIPHWKKLADKYDVDVITCMSYQTVGGRMNDQPKHDYLIRTDNISEKGINHVEFSITKDYVKLAKNRFLLVVDEFQNIRNKSTQHKAVSALTRGMMGIDDCPSRFCLLSGTPYDKPECCVNLLRLLGIISHPMMYTYNANKNQFNLTGLMEVIDFSMNVNKSKTKAILKDFSFDNKSAIRSAARNVPNLLYSEVIKDSFCGACEPFETQFEENIVNAFLKLNGKDEKMMREALDELSNAVRFNPDQMTVDYQQGGFKQIVKCLILAESAKIRAMARIAEKILQYDPSYKLIVCLNYLPHINSMAKLLNDYDPLILTGEVVLMSERMDIIEAFQEDDDRRLLFITSGVGGVGLSLHDTKGDHPRRMLYSPSYKMLDLLQTAERIYRSGMKSNTEVFVCYAEGEDNKELHLLNAMARKSTTLEGTLAESSKKQIMLPIDFPEVKERNLKFD